MTASGRDRACRLRVPTLVVFVSLGVLGGCDKPLFSDNEPRSQFDRYDAVRDRRAPAFLMDEYGERRPNIRGRLLGSP